MRRKELGKLIIWYGCAFEKGEVLKAAITQLFKTGREIETSQSVCLTKCAFVYAVKSLAQRKLFKAMVCCKSKAAYAAETFGSFDGMPVAVEVCTRGNIGYALGNYERTHPAAAASGSAAIAISKIYTVRALGFEPRGLA